MKYLISILTVTLLVSCGATQTVEETTTNSSTLNAEINSTIEQLTGAVSTWNTEEKVEKLETTFKHPGGESTMTISYSLDSEGKIANIDISSTYSHNGFDEKAEAELLGKTLEEAKNLYVAWASLASKAFVKAIKA